MAQTVIPVGDPRAVRRWSSLLSAEMLSQQYFAKKFVGTGDNSIIQEKKEVENDAGDIVSFDLSAQLRGTPVTGDNKALGADENLRFLTDEIRVDQLRKPVSSGGRMTRKRTLHNLRTVARDRLSEYWAEWKDQMMFIYLSGSRGINQDFYEALTYAGHAGNPIQAPDVDHLMYAGAATSAATITTGDIMTRTVIERLATRVDMLRATNPDASNLVPVTLNGDKHYCVVMSPYQAFSMRTDASAGNWLDIQRAAITAEGAKNKIFMGALGMINGIILHEHKSVVRFSNYGAGTNLPAARAICMGRQAGIVAYGTPGNSRMQWEEELTDFKNHVSICCGSIFGFKKTRFGGRDFGVMSVDTYALPVV